MEEEKREQESGEMKKKGEEMKKKMKQEMEEYRKRVERGIEERYDEVNKRMEEEYKERKEEFRRDTGKEERFIWNTSVQVSKATGRRWMEYVRGKMKEIEMESIRWMVRGRLCPICQEITQGKEKGKEFREKGMSVIRACAVCEKTWEMIQGISLSIFVETETQMELMEIGMKMSRNPGIMKAEGMNVEDVIEFWKRMEKRKLGIKAEVKYLRGAQIGDWRQGDLMEMNAAQKEVLKDLNE